MRFGQEIPKTLIPPELTDVEWPIWRAFWELSTERGVGMGPGPIPISAIRAAGEALGLQEQFFKPIVRAMDNAYLSHVTGKEKTFSREMMRKG